MEILALLMTLYSFFASKAASRRPLECSPGVMCQMTYAVLYERATIAENDLVTIHA